MECSAVLRPVWCKAYRTGAGAVDNGEVSVTQYDRLEPCLSASIGRLDADTGAAVARVAAQLGQA